MASKYVLGATGGLVSYIAANYYIDRLTSTPLHVKCELQPELKVYGFDLMPAVGAILKSIPESTRRNMFAKAGAPKTDDPPDWFDLFGEDPYKVEEVVPGKVWSVRYLTANFMAFDLDAKAFQKIGGVDMMEESTGARIMRNAEQFGREVSHQARKDLESIIKFENMIIEKGQCDETVRTAGPVPLYMSVVKLNNGDLLLYSPVKIHDDVDFGRWLENLGVVKWIVLGTSAHSLQLPAVMKKYPEATYIASKDSWQKLVHFKGWKKQKADFEYDNPEDLERLNNLLSEEGIKFHFVKGDCCTQACIPIAHKTALECDIIYSLSNGGFLDMSAENLICEEEADVANAGKRLFRLALATKPTSPNGALPPYRFWIMDPLSPISCMIQTVPAKDGSSCTEMAQSLRTILSEEIDQASGVHTGPITGQVFRESVDLNWNWLDGQSLLKPKEK